jgi:HEAT repeat protein
MRTLKFFAVLLAAGLSMGAAMGTARADSGVALEVKQLPAKQQSALVTAIAKARAANPDVFKRTAVVASAVEKADRQKRGPYASMTRYFFALGKPAVLPMLELLAVKGPARGNMTETAWTSLRVSLIEAVGMQRDPIAVPVLDAILDNESEFFVSRAAAEALGRIGTDASAKKLVALAFTAGPKQAAVLSAIGDCRRASVASALADFSKKPADARTTRLTLKALGGVGNAWAWKTPNVSKTGEESAVRGTAAKALVAAFARLDDKDLRLTAQKAILLVDDASTPKLIEAEKRGASAETRAALDALAAKFAKSPLHKY